MENTYDKNTWATPQWFFDQCNAVWSFNVDVCAQDWSHKCDRYFTPEMDAFKQVLGYGDRAWMNPPYSNPGKWVDWADQQSQFGALVVGLLSADTGTEWFHKVLRSPKVEVHPIKGRIQFLPPPKKFQ